MRERETGIERDFAFNFPFPISIYTHLSLLPNIEQTELISIFPQSSAFCLFFSISLLYIAVVGPVDPILARICRFWRFSFLLLSLPSLSFNQNLRL